ncbi:hypothetical protein EG799_11160 [Aurantiacibacter spongiae]|uniref:Uncharacterized protein n=2 Tax=Aurantiacibacter spongiae TaxID=2488860 RepID=A0A3N5DML1_9SPHN|nr:hypothetical protein [Aurantiacibacter spongiae]RPF72115.1 hypothetical protein EG799_11160 [Aurantiacibacter spongiae]
MTQVDLLIAASGLVALVILAGAALYGWTQWLALKRRELDLRRPLPEFENGSREGMARIEIADLKERIRKLEAIASGVDL